MQTCPTQHCISAPPLCPLSSSCPDRGLLLVVLSCCVPVCAYVGSAPRLPLPVLPAAGSLPRGSDPLAPVVAYLSNFVIAIDVADRLIDSLLASATIDLGDDEARTAFLHPVALRERSPQLVLKNTGYLRGWEFKDAACLERYLNSGHEAYRLEVMIIHKKSGRVAMMLPSDETLWPAVGPMGRRYGIQWVQQGNNRELGVGTFGTVHAILFRQLVGPCVLGSTAEKPSVLRFYSPV